MAKGGPINLKLFYRGANLIYETEHDLITSRRPCILILSLRIKFQHAFWRRDTVIQTIALALECELGNVLSISVFSKRLESVGIICPFRIW